MIMKGHEWYRASILGRRSGCIRADTTVGDV